jgi:hypothetical protein
MSFFTPDYFIHAANVLLLIAYSVRDVLWLQCISSFSLTTFRFLVPIVFPLYSTRIMIL